MKATCIARRTTPRNFVGKRWAPACRIFILWRTFGAESQDLREDGSGLKGFLVWTAGHWSPRSWPQRQAPSRLWFAAWNPFAGFGAEGKLLMLSPCNINCFTQSGEFLSGVSFWSFPLVYTAEKHVAHCQETAIWKRLATVLQHLDTPVDPPQTATAQKAKP